MGEFWEDLLTALAQLRRRADWDAAMKECQMANPEYVSAGRLAEARFVLTGDLPRDLSSLPRDDQTVWLWRKRQFQDELSLVGEQLAKPNLSDRERIALLLRESDALSRVGRTAESANAAGQALAIAEKLPVAGDGDGDFSRFALLAEAESRMDQPEAAIADARRFIEADARQGARRLPKEIQLAEIYARLRRPDDCMGILTRLVDSPSGLTVAMLNIDPVWDNLRDNAAFKSLVANPQYTKPF
jgi:hypothetical protein